VKRVMVGEMVGVIEDVFADDKMMRPRGKDVGADEGMGGREGGVEGVRRGLWGVLEWYRDDGGMDDDQGGEGEGTGKPRGRAKQRCRARGTVSEVIDDVKRMVTPRPESAADPSEDDEKERMRENENETMERIPLAVGNDTEAVREVLRRFGKERQSLFVRGLRFVTAEERERRSRRNSGVFDRKAPEVDSKSGVAVVC
jgi:hypothetical protein